MDDILLIGGGGHCNSVLDSLKKLNKFNIVGILDIEEKVGSEINGIRIIGTDKEMADYFKKGIKYAFITVGSVTSTVIREKVYKQLKDIGFKLPCIIDPTAVVSENTYIGEGTFIGKMAIVNSATEIGANCIINSGSIVEHDCKLGKFVHIASGATLSGGVKVGNSTLVGTNASVIQGRKIGNYTVIGAGSVVIKNIGDKRVAFGNPCKEVK